ncbi:hypothetical protein ABNF97_24020 [Plantactinospora sp. B6F1]|uniref:hypothetical protein n=1 Tax=Plantactinospora sp. B6F1 TaxID=3158971 RepID=UPI0032D8C245
MPAHHGFRADQQPQAVQHVARQSVQQGGQPRPVSWGEPYPFAVQLPLEDHDLVAR